MDELEISGKRYISSKRAAKENAYHVDYIGQLIRGGKILGSKVGRTWYIEEKSLADYLGKEFNKETSIKSPTFQQAAEPATPIKIFQNRHVEEPRQNSAIPLRYISDEEPLVPVIPEKASEQNWETIEQERQIYPSVISVPRSSSSRKIAFVTVVVLGLVAFGVGLGASYFIGYTNTITNGVTTASVGLIQH